ncbi:MAG TPA: hypothetical protein VG758_18125 [Hyphomicrobiaceae bacterium]|jgi:hypothetical protein|nr:hypothetical protein [Hyphomicrobiaceae bacterium]
MLARAAFLATLSLLAACAAAIPGYTPPPFKQTKVVEPMKGGDMDAEGGYHMSGQEKATDCRHLRGSIMVTISRMRHRQKEVATSPLAVGANKAATTIFGGSSKGLDRDAEYARDQARIEAYNRQLQAKGCQTVDIAAELARPAQ